MNAPALPPRPVMIGGGPAALARTPETLLVDARGGPHHRLVLPTLAQTPDLLRFLADHGFDPYRYASPAERVPALAVRRWLDSAATAAGPLVNGVGVLTVLADGALAVVIHPDAGEPLTVEVAGTPTLAPGLPRQLVPGTPAELPSFDAAAQAVLYRLAGLGPDGDRLFAGLVDLLGRGGDAASVLALLDSADPALLAGSAGAVDALRSLDAFQRAGRAAPGPLCFGDQLAVGGVAATAADSWIVAGGGDDALAAAETVLSRNPAARVAVVAERIDAAAAGNARYAELGRRHGEGGDGRLEFRTGASPGPVAVDPVSGRFTEAGVTAGGYAACVGRAAALPAAVQHLDDWARRLRGRTGGRLLFDDAGQYLGYRLHFTAAGLHHGVDVTGASSWHLPAEVFPPAVREGLAALGRRTVPPESGSSPTDLFPVVEQAARLAAARSRGTVRETDGLPGAGG